MLRTTSRFPSVLLVLSLVTVAASVGLWAGSAQAEEVTIDTGGATGASYTWTGGAWDGRNAGNIMDYSTVLEDPEGDSLNLIKTGIGMPVLGGGC